jgi:hypothetical protein
MKQSNREEMERTIKNGKKVFITIFIIASLIALGAMLFSCTPSDSTHTPNNPTNSTNCNCGVVIQSMSYNIPNNNGGVIVQSTIIVRNNCTQITKTVSGISGVVANGSQWCN